MPSTIYPQLVPVTRMSDPLPFAAPAVPNMLGLACSMLEACGQAQPRSKKGVSAPLWDYTVPHSRAAVDILRSFVANAGRMTIDVNGVPAGWMQLGSELARAVSNGVSLGLEYSLLDGPVQKYLTTVPYPNANAAKLCQQQWAEFGVARVGLPGSLIPSLSMQGDVVVVEWDKPPQLEFGTKGFFGFWRWATHTTIQQIRIGPNSGEIVTTGLVGWTLPRLVWA